MATPPEKPAPAPAPASNPSATTFPAVPMAAPSIPNLLARLGTGPPRAGRGGRRGLGRGSHRGGLHAGSGSMMPPYPPSFADAGQRSHHGGSPRRGDPNAVVQGTDTDAAISRLSAVDIGLLDDPFAQYFAGDGGPAPRRLPIINRGTYTRTQALDRIIGSFLAGGTSGAADATDTVSETVPLRQVVSLGAGTDTRALRFLTNSRRNGDDRPRFRGVRYHEIDFPIMVDRKRNIVQSVPAIRALLAGPVAENTPPASSGDVEAAASAVSGRDASGWHVELGHDNELWVHGVDLRQLAGAGNSSGGGGGGGGDGNDLNTEPAITLLGLRTDVPTLLVSECCLCYLEPTAATGVLQWFADRVPTSLGAVLYEPIRPHDAFGRTMVANLAARGIEMPTLTAYPDSAAQEARLNREAGLTNARCRAVDVIWDRWVDEAEQERVNHLEGLDEIEEWKLLASHYIIAWGSRGPYFDAAWKRLYET